MSFERQGVAGEQRTGSESIRGARGVRERAGEMRERAGQKIRERGGHREEQNVGRYERVASGIGGAALLWFGLRRRTLGGVLAALGGASLLYRGATGRCMVYRRFGVDTTHEGLSRGVEVERSITVAQSPEEVYRFWRDERNLPEFMSFLESVRDVGGGRSRWTMKGMPVEWEYRIAEDVPGRRIRWRTEPDGEIEIESEWEVRFEQAPGGRGTEVHVRMYFEPQRGRLAMALAPFLRSMSRVKLGQDLHRMKQILETGEITTSRMRGEEPREPSYRGERRLPEEVPSARTERAGASQESGIGREAH